MTAEEQKALFDELNRLTVQMRAELKKIEALGGDPLKKTNEALEAIQKRMDEVEIKLARPALGSQRERDEQTEKSIKVKEAFLGWCRSGQIEPDMRKALMPSPEDLKVLQTQDMTAGGALVMPAEMVNEIIKGVVDFSPIRSVARVRITSTQSIMAPKRTGTFSASWVSEIGTRSESSGLTYGRAEIPTHELTAEVYLSFAELEDAAFNMEAEIQMEATEQFGVAEGTAFITGTGAGKPQGVITNSDVGITNAGSATAITADGLISCLYAVKDAYARNGTWAFKRSSLSAIRKLKDGNGAYVWQPALAGAQPATILDRPYIECTDLSAEGADNKVGIFGDFRRGYWIADRITMQVIRDNVTRANVGQLKLVFRKRVGGQVVVAEALRILKCAA